MRRPAVVELDRSWPEVEKDLKKRYLQERLAEKRWPTVKSLAAACGISAPTARSWLILFGLPLPGE